MYDRGWDSELLSTNVCQPLGLVQSLGVTWHLAVACAGKLRELVEDSQAACARFATPSSITSRNAIGSKNIRITDIISV